MYGSPAPKPPALAALDFHNGYEYDSRAWTWLSGASDASYACMYVYFSMVVVAGVRCVRGWRLNTKGYKAYVR